MPENILPLVFGGICAGLISGFIIWLLLTNKQKRLAEENVELQEKMQTELEKTFRVISTEALKDNHRIFVDLAKGELQKREQSIENTVVPIKESLEKVNEQIKQMEIKREGAYGSLTQQVKSLGHAQNVLTDETRRLVTALRAPKTRGRWGEIQLRRVVEFAGMIQHCDFIEQKTIDSDEKRIQPDVIVYLPGEKNIVIDAKAPLQAFLDALDIDDVDAKREKLNEHATQVRQRIKKLSSKGYWDQFDSSPEFVVMFLPGESFFSAALEFDPTLIEIGVNKNVILSTPTTLIALLKAVAYGWQEKKIEESARAISNLGRDLYERISVFSEHIGGVGKGLKSAINKYNEAIGSLESRVFPGARKFAELGIQPNKDLPPLMQIEVSPREPQIPEFSDGELESRIENDESETQ
jgi:DNA recombination protein RmuC